jgi:hypothetical protein
MRLSALANPRDTTAQAFGSDPGSVPAVDGTSEALIPTKGQQMRKEAQELATAIHMYCRFCSEVSVNADDTGPSFSKLIAVFQKNINVRAAYATLFADNSFIDWERVALLSRDRCYMDAVSWVRVVTRYTDVENAPKSDSDMRTLLREHPSLQHFDECLRGSGLAAAAQTRPYFGTLVRLYLLVNIQRLQSLNAIEQFFSICFNHDARAEAMHFFSLLANRQFDHDEQTRAFTVLMGRFVRVRIQCVQQELEIMQLRERELEGLFRQKTMRALVGRPRLRSKLRSQTPASGSLFSMDQLAQWNANIRFPNVFSMKQRKRLYFVMAQCHLDPSACVPGLLRDRELAATVLRYPVKQPEIDKIHECIVGCRIVSDPFPELHQFRASCFESFANEHKTRLRLNDLLHLFIAAYQNPSIWKSVWKLVFPVLSIQIIRDVEAFVARVPFPHEAVLSILFEQRFPPERPGSPTPSSASSVTYRPGGSCYTPSLPPSPRLRSSFLDGERPEGHRILGEDDDAAHGVGDGEAAVDERPLEHRGDAAPLPRDDAPEPGEVDLGVPGGGGDPPHGLPAKVHDVEDQHTRQAVLEEELGTEHRVGRALGLDDAGQGVGGVAHVTRGDEDHNMDRPSDQQDLLPTPDQPCAKIPLFTPAA